MPDNKNSTHGLRCAPNQLLNQLTPAKLRVSDIPYLP
jgi:hypothetical protein